jgi:diacylglycerol kinase (ATP)
MQTARFSWKQRVKSFHYAWEGVIQFFKSQQNAFLHAAATIGVVILGYWKHISVTEWVFIVIMIALVWAFELMNTAIEALCDMVYPGPHPRIKIIKDVAAAAVLVMAAAAFVTGCIIFIPKFI